MIEHIVLYNFSKDITEDVIDQTIEKFRQCRDLVEGFMSIEYGENCSPKIEKSSGFNYGIIMKFENEHALSAYYDLEEHKEAKQIMDEFLINKLIFDINW